jgi:hypothetical protein
LILLEESPRKFAASIIIYRTVSANQPRLSDTACCEASLTKRGTPCTVCTHKDRPLIEFGLVAGTSLRVLGQRFDVSWHAVGRHGRAHLNAVQRAAILRAQRPEAIDLDQLRQTESEGLLGAVAGQRARLLQQSDLAMTGGDVRAAVAVEAAITGNLALTAKLLGQLVQRHDVRHSSILLTPDYLTMRAALMAALRPFPDAARTVGAALHAIEADAAKDITEAGRKPVPVTIEHAAEPTPMRVLPPPLPPAPLEARPLPAPPPGPVYLPPPPGPPC